MNFRNLIKLSNLITEKSLWIIFLLIYFLIILGPASAWAAWGGMGFESRIQSLTSSLASVLLPAVAILGLLYAAMLAASGDEGAKKRMILVVIASVIGFLAPLIIRWFQLVAGG